MVRAESWGSSSGNACGVGSGEAASSRDPEPSLEGSDQDSAPSEGGTGEPSSDPVASGACSQEPIERRRFCFVKRNSPLIAEDSGEGGGAMAHRFFLCFARLNVLTPCSSSDQTYTSSHAAKTKKCEISAGTTVDYCRTT